MISTRNICTGIIAVAVQAAGVLAAAVSSPPTVDLGYATYQGYYNDTFDLNIWKSVRYAAPPVGKLRWQAPQPPLKGNREIVPAIDQPPLCPQSGAFGVPDTYGFNSALGNEDCLYLNVYAAPNASNLPVLLWIHGGGHSVFGATYDPSAWMNVNENGFITVEIQYRLGAFGFLASADIKNNGQLNAGLLDQRFALEWVQRHISKFGGDATRVTIGGESSGAGCVLHHVMGYGGEETDIFSNAIAASPYLPAIHWYNDTVPTKRYNRFAELAGCSKESLKSSNHSSIFDCLVATDSVVLQRASGTVSTTQGTFGTFGFSPVVDGDYIQERPAVQLSRAKVIGKRLLVGNNANEGVPLTNPQVNTTSAYDDFIATTFPSLSPSDTTLLRKVYQIDDLPCDDDLLYDTTGSRGPTALCKSGMAIGIQQAVFNIAGENEFDCPAQWLAEAFSSGSRKSWKYQYSLMPNYHGADLTSYFSVGAELPNADFMRTMQKIWGSFIIHDTPVISALDATAKRDNATVPANADGSIKWPEFTLEYPIQMNLNTTGGDVSRITVPPYLKYNVRGGPGIVNTFSLTDAFAWEGGRGKRCDFWRSVSERVPQ